MFFLHVLVESCSFVNTLFKNKYRIKSTRLKHYDYSSNGAYFVTICTKNRECCLGDVIDGEMKLSVVGKIVSEEWIKTEQIRKYVQLDEWVIMPNHFHGIVIINNDNVMCNVETPRRGVSTTSNQNPCHKLEWKSHSLGSIICQFKSITTKRIRSIGDFNFTWQHRYYEHIIRNENKLNVIREYIQNNPLRWKLDNENPEIVGYN